jgi:hypothetical protein
MRLRKILFAVTLLLLVIAGVIAFALSRLDPNDHLDRVYAKVKESTGRQLKIDGKLGYSLSLQPTIAADGIRFQNAPWGSRPDMLGAKRIEIQIALLPLLSGNVEVRGLTLIEPDLLLEISADGKKNWEFTRAQEKATQPADGSPPWIDVHKARIENGVIIYREAKPKRETRYGLERISLTSKGSLVELSGNASLNSVPLEVQARLDHGGTLGRKGAIGKAELSFSGPGVKIGARGQVPLGPGSLDGLDMQFTTEVPNWITLGKLTGDKPMTLPALKAQGTVQVKNEVLSVNSLKANLGKSSATGTLRFPLGKRGGFEALLESPFVDLTELQGQAKSPQTKSDGRVFSAEPFELQGLRELDGKADLKIAKLAMRDGKTLDGVQAQTLFNKGKIVADPIRILVEGREVRLRVSADASSGKALALNLGVDAQGVSLGALAAMFNVPGAPEASPTDISIRLAGAGHSVQSLMAGATGDVRVVVGPGRLKNQAINFGADVSELLNALNPARTSDPYTDLKCAVIRLPIRQGIARVTNSIAAETAKVNVLVSGVIDFRNEALDLGFRTKAVTGLGVGLGSLANLGRLRGSFANPRVEIDSAGTASAAGQLGLAAATGGLSLLAGAFLAERFPEQPCQVALTGVMPRQQAESESKPGVVDSFVGGIKRLFGR